MKQTVLKLFILTLFFAACQGKPEEKDNNTNKVKTAAYFFSDSTKMDTFKVELSGVKPKDMLLTFQITAANGKEIYNRIFKAKDLIENYKETVDLSKNKNQHDFIMEEFNLFLEEDNLLEPGIMPEQQPDKHSPDKDFFFELQKSQLPGFKFRSNKETKIYIGWSEKKQKVKVYYECCEKK